MSAKTNQDTSSVVWPFKKRPDAALFFVLDGHGGQGHHVSRYCNRKVVELLNANDSALSRPGAALAEAFVEADACLEREHRDWTDNGGSTAVAVLMLGKQCFIANAGDSRFVMAVRQPNGELKAKDLSTASPATCFMLATSCFLPASLYRRVLHTYTHLYTPIHPTCWLSLSPRVPARD